MRVLSGLSTVQSWARYWPHLMSVPSLQVSNKMKHKHVQISPHPYATVCQYITPAFPRLSCINRPGPADASPVGHGAAKGISEGGRVMFERKVRQVTPVRAEKLVSAAAGGQEAQSQGQECIRFEECRCHCRRVDDT